MQFFSASIVMKGESYCCRHIVAFVGAFAPFVLPFVCAEGTEPSLDEWERGKVRWSSKQYKKTLIRETSNKGLLLFS